MPKPSRSWKGAERKIASAFGTRRNPLSGSNSGVTASDSRHPHLFIENKHSKNGHAVQRIYYKAKDLAAKEGKVPLVTLTGANRTGFLVVCEAKDLKRIAELYDPPQAEQK